MLARELETGTFRYTWTQGVGRMRWAVATLGSGALSFAILVTLFGALISWRNQPLLDSGITQRLHTTVFPETGIAAAGWTAAGFAFGVLAGLLWRRVVPAIATAFAAWFGLAFLAADVRLNYQSPLHTTSLDTATKDLPVSQWWTRGGVRISDGQINAALKAAGSQFNVNGGKPTAVTPGSSLDPTQFLTQHGYALVTSYQPDRRYWTFQWIEFGWLAALTLLLFAAVFRFLRRRVI